MALPGVVVSLWGWCNTVLVRYFWFPLLVLGWIL